LRSAAFGALHLLKSFTEDTFLWVPHFHSKDCMLKIITLACALACANASAATLRVELFSGPDDRTLTRVLTASAQAASGESFLVSQIFERPSNSKAALINGKLTPVDKLVLGLALSAKPSSDGGLIVESEFSELAGVGRASSSIEIQCQDPLLPDASNHGAPALEPRAAGGPSAASAAGCFGHGPDVELPLVRSWSLLQKTSFKGRSAILFDHHAQGDQGAPIFQRMRLTLTP
jgi:hypothetical protein